MDDRKTKPKAQGRERMPPETREEAEQGEPDGYEDGSFERLGRLLLKGRLKKLKGNNDWRLLIALFLHANFKTGKAFPGQATLALDTGIAKKHVNRHVKRLEKAKIIKRIGTHRYKNQDCTLYQFRRPKLIGGDWKSELKRRQQGVPTYTGTPPSDGGTPSKNKRGPHVRDGGSPSKSEGVPLRMGAKHPSNHPNKNTIQLPADSDGSASQFDSRLMKYKIPDEDMSRFKKQLRRMLKQVGPAEVEAMFRLLKFKQSEGEPVKAGLIWKFMTQPEKIILPPILKQQMEEEQKEEPAGSSDAKWDRDFPGYADMARKNLRPFAEDGGFVPALEDEEDDE